MTGAEADARWAASKADLMKNLVKLSMPSKRTTIREAVAFRSGPDSVNSVYMGSLAKAMLYDALGGGGLDSLEDLLGTASHAQLNKGMEVCASVIKYMRDNPKPLPPKKGASVVEIIQGQIDMIRPHIVMGDEASVDLTPYQSGLKDGLQQALNIIKSAERK